MTEAAASRRRLGWAGPVGLLAALAYLPALLTARGVVAADTKQYLYLDPGHYLAGAASLWDPDQFGGWVTHQTVGYLWPMGPFHWVLHELGVPVWVAQRLWLATLLVLGGTGVWWCCRVLGLDRAGATAGAVLYQLSPYVLLYAPRTSVLLLPWAGLGWLVGLTALAARRGGWRYPAAMALVVGTISGTNVTAALLVGFGPLLWLAWAAFGSREVSPRQALAATGRIGVLCLGTCAAWLGAIVVQARYGADVLAYSETVEAVSSTSLASEVLRGLGYWLFYGGDVTGAWNSASGPYLSAPVLLALGFGLSLVAIGAAVIVRWAQRGFVALLLLVGTVVSVGAHPLADPSLYGQLLSGSTRNTLVLALRSSTRALPLVLLGLALAVAAAVTAVGRRLPSTAMLLAAVVVVLAALNLPALWNGTYVDTLQRRPEDVPTWWTDVAAGVDGLPGGSRVLELPGAEFAAYRWGTTNDALLPGLTARPTLTRDLLPLGSPPLMDLLLAIDDRFQTGTIDGPEVAAVARLLGASGIVVRGDTAFERFRSPRPEPTESFYGSGAPGVGPLQGLGSPMVNTAAVAGLDERALADPSVGQPVAPVALVPVEPAGSVVRVRPAASPVLLAGDGEGIVAAAASGLLDGREAVVTAASRDAGALSRLAEEPGARLVLTDTNRLRARQWRGSQDTTGFTEDGRNGVLRTDEADVRLPVFPDSSPGSTTRADQRGGATVQATAYGEPNAYRPEDRPFFALDGDPSTAWLVGDRGEVAGERLRITFDDPREVASVRLTQPLDAGANRWITEVVVRTDAGAARQTLTEPSRTAAGQRLDLPGSIAGPTSFVELEVSGTNVGRRASYAGVGPVGFAEVDVDGLALEEVVVLPTDLLAATGPASLDRELDVVLTRLRHDPLDRWRDDEEAAMARSFRLPAGRRFAVEGTARLSARAGDEVLAELVEPDASVRAVASSRLAGSPWSWGRSAIDGDPATAWTTAFGVTEGASLRITLDEGVTLDGLDLRIVNDGRHSVPTALVLRNEQGDERAIPVSELPVHAAGEVPPVVPVSFEPMTGRELTLTVASAAPVTTVDRRYGDVVVLPVAIAELGGGIEAPPLPATVDSGCRTDLLRVDGQGRGLRVSGSTEALLARQPVSLAWCDGEPDLDLTAGVAELRAASGVETGLDLDRLVLRSAPGGIAPRPGAPEAAAEPARVALTVSKVARSEVTGTLTPLTGAEPFWLVLGQGYNEGWRATVGGRDLGPPEVLDGGMNAWLIDPVPTGAATFRLRWEPQTWVGASQAVALLAVATCLVLLVVPWRRRSTESTWIPWNGAQPALVGWEGHGGPTGWQATLTATIVMGLVTAAVVSAWYAPLVAAATLLALRVPRLRRVPAIGAVTAVALVGLFYVARQVISRPAAGFGWPSAFERAHQPALLAVVLVAADALVAAIRARQPVHYPAPEPTRPEPP